MSIPLSVIIRSLRATGTTFSQQRSYHFHPGCAYVPCPSWLFVFTPEPQTDEWVQLNRVTAARDGLVKVFDVGAEVTVFDSASPHSRGFPTCSGWKQRTIRCHSDSVKRITTELSPDVFLTVSEVSVPVPVFVIAWVERTKKDGSVRQHDLRAPEHPCGTEGACHSAPLVKVSHRLFSMSIAPSAPHQLVVAGDHPCVSFILP